MREHRYAVGQLVKYSESGGRGRYWPDASDPAWAGSYEITNLLPAGSYEPSYEIHDAEQSYYWVVGEGQLCEDPSRVISHSTGEFFLLWAKMNVAMTRELQPTWTSFVSAMEAELSRKNHENHQLRQDLEMMRRREIEGAL
ncbi:hypothetical protein [Methylobacterium durans]|uniref:Uncharacterized protein n=1 Tax=Methylobacterium durans TaxID=2202825 RepID=A0A2U8WCN0_9HYPH|nr:hypothetical protein [Methylobacterium durans]AWN43843.1 hypothetical protein DK389_29130 [Methylobacterium durans]